MKARRNSVILAIVCLAIMIPVKLSAQKHEDRQLLRVRETVWRAWFAGDIKPLEELVPPETIVMSSGEEQWKHRADVLRTATEFHAKGGRLVRLEFPHTEIQHFGNVAVVWSNYVLETELDGKQSLSSGRATEIFVRRNGRWVNPGWHTDSTK